VLADDFEGIDEYFYQENLPPSIESILPPLLDQKESDFPDSLIQTQCTATLPAELNPKKSRQMAFLRHTGKPYSKPIDTTTHIGILQNADPGISAVIQVQMLYQSKTCSQTQNS
jgi:hypothetical protein